MGIQHIWFGINIYIYIYIHTSGTRAQDHTPNGNKGRLKDSRRRGGTGGRGGERLGWEDKEEGGCDIANSRGSNLWEAI